MQGNYKSLTDTEVIASRKKYGKNIIERENNESFFKLLIETLGDPIIRILIIALFLKIILFIRDFDWYETIGIVISIILASLISTISEYGSARAFERLQKEASKIKAKVLRNNKIQEIFAEEVVVNDILILSAGDKIPADAIIIEGNLMVDESSINGESVEVYKTPVKKNIKQENKIYMGTVVYGLNATALVTSVGTNTMYGKLSIEIQTKKDTSPLKLKLIRLAKSISKIGYIGAFLVSISYLFSEIIIKNNFNYLSIIETLSNYPLMLSYVLYAITLSVTIIVVSVPEGLPMMITLVLSSNMKKMLKNNVLVRKLVGIETAGSLNILFTDKTGTLTKGNLTVSGIVTCDTQLIQNRKELLNYPKYYEIIKNSIVYNSDSIYDAKEHMAIDGNATDKSLIKFIQEEKEDTIKILDRIYFNSDNKYMISIVNINGHYIKLVKGAYEKIIPHCQYYYNTNMEKKLLTNKKNINSYVENLNSQGNRIIALAISNQTNTTDSLNNLIFVGLVLIQDEIREEAKEGIKLVNASGIQTIMVTGDNKETANNIGKQIGLINNSQDIVLTSEELNKMSDFEIKQKLPKLRIIARSLPHDKSRMVRISKELDLVVGMTGDGVNDAPALKKADVGFAMGSGTQVAKDASDIVILDDNFLSISKAVLFGRTIYKSIRKFIIFQLTVNVCAILISLISPFIGINQPITVIQMLWINMIMDTLAGIAFAYEPPLKEYMMELPHKKNDHILNKYMINQILFDSIYATLVLLIFLKIPIFQELYRNNDYLMTAFFGMFIFMSLFNAFNARTSRINILANLNHNLVFIVIMLFVIITQVIFIYLGGNVFRTVDLNIKEFGIMLIISLSIIPIDFIRKIIYKKTNIYQGV